MVRRTLGHYEILEPLGEGGMGEVYRARDSTLDREVAIKVLSEDFADDSDRVARFQREAKVVASLNHVNIAAVYGFEEADGIRFIAMELVEGETLAERMARPLPIDVEDALRIVRQIAEALEAAHENGVIHRDLKPDNIMVTADDRVKVLDFGLASAYDADSLAEVSPGVSASPTVAGPTLTGAIVGTVAYMSPEQVRGEPADKRTDVWAFGCVFYEMLTGKRPFQGENVAETLAAVLKAQPDWDLLPPETPHRAASLLRRCLRKDPARRLRDVGDARLEIDEVLRQGLADWGELGEGPYPSAATTTSISIFWRLAVGASVIGTAAVTFWTMLHPAAPPQDVPHPAIMWNVWAEPAGDALTFSPAPYLAPETDHIVAIDLSSIGYGRSSQGVHEIPPSVPFQARVADWLDDPELESVTLTAVLLADPDFFDQPARTAQDFTVDLRKIRRLRDDGEIVVDADPFSLLGQFPDPDFLFGRVQFVVRTRDREGSATLGVSFWSGGRPLDEFGVRFCVASEQAAAGQCERPAALQSEAKGIGALRAANENAPFPDAALYFWQPEEGSARGVLSRKDDGASQESDPVTWSLENTSLDQFVDTLQDTILPNIGNARYDEDAVRRLGIDLYNLLFPPRTAEHARRAFEAFVGEYLGGPAAEVGHAPVIFVRVVREGSDVDTLIPLGFVAVPVDDQPAEFLGFHFQMQSPLEERQSYAGSSECISRWVMAMPPEGVPIDAVLGEARNRVGGKYAAWSSQVEHFFDGLGPFGDWLRDHTQHDPATAVVVLSHHDHVSNTLWFTETDALQPLAVQRTFEVGSVVVLDACRTGGPGPIEFIRRFNDRGMQAVIATSTEVDPNLAGDFLVTFTDVLEETADDGDATLSGAFFSTLLRLRDLAAPPTDAGIVRAYGVEALAYSILGNGNLRLCPPSGGSQ